MRILFPLFFGSFLALAVMGNSCPQDTSECAAYCHMSEKLKCSEDNYLLHFGYKYCHRYLDNAERFTAPGQQILAKIRSCLILTLDSQENLTCENLSDIAFESHYKCYVDNGYCSLGPHDRFLLFWLMKSQLFNKALAPYAQRIAMDCKKPLESSN